MQGWTDQAVVLANRAHGENHSIASLFTERHGAMSGLVFGGQGKSKGAILQAGNSVQTDWSTKTDGQLGQFNIELEQSRSGVAIADRKALLGLNYVTDLLHLVLPEGEAYPPLYAATLAVLDHLEAQDIWPILLVKWELGLLQALGYGLILDRCVATGRLLEDGAELVFVSPKSGGAVSYEAGLPYQDRMLTLPSFLIDMGEPTVEAVKSAFELTGYFLNERLCYPVNKELPDSRERYISKIKPI